MEIDNSMTSEEKHQFDEDSVAIAVALIKKAQTANDAKSAAEAYVSCIDLLPDIAAGVAVLIQKLALIEEHLHANPGTGGGPEGEANGISGRRLDEREPGKGPWVMA